MIQMKKFDVAVCFILLFGMGHAHAQEPAPKSTSDGVFTEEQAQRGAVAYSKNCSGCHGEKLLSIGPQFPSLAGRSFRNGWVGKTIGEKFEFVRTMMPPKAGRSLDDQVYLDIVAYILRFNKVPAGSQMLTPDLQTLNQIVIALPVR